MQTDSIHKIGTVSNIRPVRKINYSIFSLSELKNMELKMQRGAVLTNDWFYYQNILEIRKAKVEAENCSNEILEKYPYDGQSTFAQLLAKEIEKQNEGHWIGLQNP